MALAFACSGLTGSRAEAQPNLVDKAAAQSLFEDALQLMGAKRFAEACPKLEESERLDPALGTRFRLAECDEAIGRLASAWAGYLEVADLAHAAHQADREAVARSRAAGIEPKLPRVKLDVVSPDTPGLEVVHDAAVIRRGQWGSPVPIDPGVYTVTAHAPGKRAWRGSVTVSPDGTTATLTVPVLDDAAPVVEPLPVVLPSPLPPPPREKPAGLSATRVVGLGLVGVGVASLATGLALGFVAKSDYVGAGSNCGASSCNASGKATIDGARSLANGATAAVVAGSVLGAGGLAMFVFGPRSRSADAASASVRVVPFGAALEGSF